MDFLENHTEITKNELQEVINFSIQCFKSFKEKGRSPEYAIDTTKNRIYDTYIKPNIITKYSSHFDRVYDLYIYAFNYYDPKIDATKLVLKNEIYTEFQSFISINKISNFKYDEDFDNLTFQQFVSYLLKYDVAKKATDRLTKNCDLYKIFFDNNYYSKFTFERFEEHVINSDLYRELFAKFYPNKPIPVAIKEVDIYNNIHYKIVTNKETLNKPFTKNIKIIPEEDEELNHENKERLIATLSLDEKSYLFYFMCKIINNTEMKNTDPFNLPYTELLRLNTIIDFKDVNCFSNNYRDSNHYKILSEGINFFPPNERCIFIKRLIRNIKDLKLKKTTKYLNELLDKIEDISLSKKNNKI